MERIILVSFLVITFMLLLLGDISLNRKRGFLFSLLGFVLLAVTVVAGFFVPRLREVSILMWFLGLFAASRVIGFLIIRRQAGQLLVKVDEVNRQSKRWLLLFAVPIWVFLFLSFLPARVSSSGAGFFLERLPFWLVLIVGLVYLLLFAFSRVELRENGIVQFDNFIDWSETLSYSWWEFELDEWLRLRIKIRGASHSEASTVIYLVHQTEKKLIDKLLARKIKGKVQSPVASRVDYRRS